MREKMTGKIIKSFEVDGFGVRISFTDGTYFEYDASDGGYSTWDYGREE
jgi:hypothetical protein